MLNAERSELRLCHFGFSRIFRGEIVFEFSLYIYTEKSFSYEIGQTHRKSVWLKGWGICFTEQVIPQPVGFTPTPLIALDTAAGEKTEKTAAAPAVVLLRKEETVHRKRAALSDSSPWSVLYTTFHCFALHLCCIFHLSVS